MTIGTDEQAVIVLAYGGEVDRADVADELGWPSSYAASRATRLLGALCTKGLLRIRPNHGKVYELTRAGQLAAELLLELEANQPCRT